VKTGHAPKAASNIFSTLPRQLLRRGQRLTAIGEEPRRLEMRISGGCRGITEPAREDFAHVAEPLETPAGKIPPRF
jgi:hypothetical protein